MAWNEPDNHQKDPWNSGNDGPPDLDEAFRRFKEKFTGKKNNNGNKKPSNGGSSNDLPMGLIGLVLGAILVVVTIMDAWYIVQEPEQAVVLRFGEYLKTETSGFKFKLPLIDKVYKENVSKVRSQELSNLMLTEDDNIVRVRLSVQYTVDNLKAFLLEVKNPEISLQHAAESALRHVIGSSELNQILTDGRVAIAIEVKSRLQDYLNVYHTGINIATVNIEDAQPPEAVQAAFDDVTRAKEDEARAKNEAETYRNGIVPEARGRAAREIEEANAYKEQVIANATGEASRFEQLLTEYQKAPAVTRQRMYLDTLQKVYSNTSKVMVDVDSGNLLYLPLDKLMTQAASQLPRHIESNAQQNTSSNASENSERSSRRGFDFNSRRELGGQQR